MVVCLSCTVGHTLRRLTVVYCREGVRSHLECVSCRKEVSLLVESCRPSVCVCVCVCVCVLHRESCTPGTII